MLSLNYGKISSIEEVLDVKKKDSSTGRTRMYDGYMIQTDRVNIYLLISNMQDCCEEWGYATSEDDISSFINEEVNKIEIVDEEYEKYNIENLKEDGETQAVFVNLETTGGTLQFAIYNAHNGYYGHKIFILIDNKSFFEDTI